MTKALPYQKQNKIILMYTFKIHNDTLQCRVCKMYQSVLWLAICDLAVACTLCMYLYVAINTQLFLEKKTE